MGLNIRAQRKLSLAGFAEGWDECFLMLKAVNEEQRMAWFDVLKDDAPDSVAIPKLRELVNDVVVGGQVVTTNDDGSTSKVALTKEDVPTMVDALNIYWLREVLYVSSGADRLKAAI